MRLCQKAVEASSSYPRTGHHWSSNENLCRCEIVNHYQLMCHDDQCLIAKNLQINLLMFLKSESGNWIIITFSMHCTIVASSTNVHVFVHIKYTYIASLHVLDRSVVHRYIGGTPTDSAFIWPNNLPRYTGVSVTCNIYYSTVGRSIPEISAWDIYIYEGVERRGKYEHWGLMLRE